MNQSNSNSTGNKSLDQIQNLLGKGATLEAKEIDLQDFSRVLTKMPQRNDK